MAALGGTYTRKSSRCRRVVFLIPRFSSRPVICGGRGPLGHDRSDRRGGENGDPARSASFAASKVATALAEQGDDRSIVLTPNDVVVVVEVCAKLLRQGMLTSRVVTGNIYRLHALPARNTEQPPTQPVYSPAPDAEDSTEPSPVESNALEDGAPAQWAYLDSPVAAPAAAVPKVA